MAILWLGAGVVAHIPIPAIAGVTAWMGLCLLDWSAWRRLPKMSRVDAAAFLATAVAVLAVNAVLAVAIGCSLYVARAVWIKWVRPEPTEPMRSLSQAAD
jgi:SulP family sulfate permease